MEDIKIWKAGLLTLVQLMPYILEFKSDAKRIRKYLVYIKVCEGCISSVIQL
jgi:hypothetical protein